MPLSRPNLVRPQPRPAPRRRGRAVHTAGGPGAPISQVINPWNFGARIWIAFDPPNTPNPTWIEVSGLIDTGQPITITHGRGDGLADTTATTLSATADNTDGRWATANTLGIWYGLIRKGSWLKVEILPPSGTISSRFVGFLNNLPTVFEGQYASSQITASDRYERLGQAPVIISQIQSEVLTDPNLAGTVKGYWNLHEASVSQAGVTTFGDTSGQGAAPMVLFTTGGVPNGTGFIAANANSPGFDSTKCPTFSPPGGAASNSGSALITNIAPPPQGTFNLANGAYAGLYACVELWFQALGTASGSLFFPLFSLIDDSTNFSVQAYWSSFGPAAGYMAVGSGATNNANLISYADVQAFSSPHDRVDDGQWHHLILGAACTSAGGGWLNRVAILDGTWVTSTAVNGGSSGTSGMNFTRLSVGASLILATTPAPWQFGAANISDVAYYWGDLAGYIGTPPDVAAHYTTGFTGNYNESTDARVARVARYGGVPVPQAIQPSGLLPGNVQRYAPGTGPWTNLSAGAHNVGTQSMSGRPPLDVMQEAARTEGMPLYVDRSGYLAMQPSTTRQNTSPSWTINALDLDPTTSQADDFAYTTNQAAVTPNGQAAQTVIGGTGSPGRLSQAKYGVYTNGGSLATASLNPLEAQSLGLSAIQLRADPGPRWSPLVVEVATLATQPGYGNAWLDAVLATEISTPIRVTNQPAQVGGGSTDMLVEGWVETITSGNIVLSLNVSPIQGPTYQLDDVVLGHIDTDGSTVATPGGISSAAASFLVSTTGAATGSALWTTNGADFPFDINIGGEQITVTGIAGGSSPQTFTVIRSVNGVVASHPFGAAVSLWQPLTLAY